MAKKPTRKQDKTRTAEISIVSMTKAYPLAKLKPYAKNPRKNDQAVETLEKSLLAYGPVAPIIVDESGRICAGHTRYKSATNLGLKTFPVIVCRFPSEASFAAYNITDNATAELATWAETELQEIVAELDKTDEIDMVALGLDDARLLELLQADDGTHDVNFKAKDHPDLTTLEVPKEPKTKPGDLYMLGDHRILCGDATNPDDVARLVGDDRVDMIWTDPPYAVFGSSTGIAKDITDDRMVRPFFRSILRNGVEVLKPWGHVYICCDWRSWASWWEEARGVALAPKNMIVWDKGGGLGAMFANCHELMFFATRKPVRKRMVQKMSGERTVKGTNVWRMDRAGQDETGTERQHNAQKPLALAQTAIEHGADPGEIVLDLFVGSGTSIEAAEKSGRRCFAMDLEPGWVDVSIERWENVTGKKAEKMRVKRNGRRQTKKASA